MGVVMTNQQTQWLAKSPMQGCYFSSFKGEYIRSFYSLTFCKKNKNGHDTDPRLCLNFSLLCPDISSISAYLTLCFKPYSPSWFGWWWIMIESWFLTRILSWKMIKRSWSYHEHDGEMVTLGRSSFIDNKTAGHPSYTLAKYRTLKKFQYCEIIFTTHIH